MATTKSGPPITVTVMKVMIAPVKRMTVFPKLSARLESRVSKSFPNLFSSLPRLMVS